MSQRSNPAADTPGVTASVAELVGLRVHAEQLGPGPRRVPQQAVAGPYLSAFRGGGIEFDEIRAYQAGDDVRAIDWRVTARTGRPHSRVFREEREVPVWIFLDCGPSMRFGTRCAFKSVVAARAAALLGWAAREMGDRVGAFVRAPGRSAELDPRSGTGPLLAVLAAAADATQRGGPDRSQAPTASFDADLGRLAARVRSGSRVFVVSDFCELGDAGRRHLAQITRRADLTCLLVSDPLEESAPPPGRYRVSDGDAMRTISSSDLRWRERYAASFEAHRDALADFCRAHRSQLLAIRTDSDPIAAVSLATAAGRIRGSRRTS